MITPTELKKLTTEQNKNYTATLKAKHPDLIELLEKKHPGLKVAEKVFLYSRQIDVPVCLVCSKPARFRNINLGYSDFCGDRACYSKYRAANSITEKAKQQQSVTAPKCQHCSSPVQKKKNGVWGNYCSKKCRGQLNSLKSRDKARATCRTTLGVDHPRKSPAINQRLEAMWMNKYGVDNPAKDPNIRKKMQATCEKRYGKPNPGHLNSAGQNPNLEVLRDVEQLKKLYPKHNPYEIAAQLGVHFYTVYNYLHQHQLMDAYKSSFEKQVLDFLINELGIENIRENDRTILGGRELDIVLADYNLAIECNGLFWHHDSIERIDRNYHQRKFLECEKKGIQLLTIFSDVWEHKRDVIKQMLRHKLGQSTKIHGRKCTVKELGASEARPFLEQHHIQGFTGARHHYGLYYLDTLVSVASFSPPRMGIGRSKDHTYELVRFSTAANVVGGASKLIQHFTKEHNFTSIVSYSDNEWSQGNLYQVLGFELTHEQRPGYWYVPSGRNQRLHRLQFAKYRLVEQGFDSSLTEAEIMNQRGYLRVWDCGKRTWLLKV